MNLCLGSVQDGVKLRVLCLIVQLKSTKPRSALRVAAFEASRVEAPVNVKPCQTMSNHVKWIPFRPTPPFPPPCLNIFEPLAQHNVQWRHSHQTLQWCQRSCPSSLDYQAASESRFDHGSSLLQFPVSVCCQIQ